MWLGPGLPLGAAQSRVRVAPHAVEEAACNLKTGLRRAKCPLRAWILARECTALKLFY